MKQSEPCIQNNNNKYKKKDKVKKGNGRTDGRERESVKIEKFFIFFFLSLLSKIYRNRIVGFRQRIKQS